MVHPTRSTMEPSAVRLSGIPTVCLRVTTSRGITTGGMSSSDTTSHEPRTSRKTPSAVVSSQITSHDMTTCRKCPVG